MTLSSKDREQIRMIGAASKEESGYSGLVRKRESER